MQQDSLELLNVVPKAEASPASAKWLLGPPVGFGQDEWGENLLAVCVPLLYSICVFCFIFETGGGGGGWELKK